MIGIPNTWVKTYRGKAVNEAGDIVDSLDEENVVLDREPAFIKELALPSREWHETETGITPRHVRRHQMRLSADADIQDDDVVRDLRSGTLHQVDRVTVQQGVGIRPDLRAVLRVVT